MELYDEIVSKLQAEDKPHKLSGEWVITTCVNPEHNDTNPSAGVNIHSGVIHCFSCGHSSMYLSGEVDEDALRRASYKQVVGLLEEIDINPKVDVQLPPKASDIDFDVRGIPKHIIQQLGIYYCTRGKYKGRLITPIYNADEELSGFSSWLPPKESKVFENVSYVEPEERFKQSKYVHSIGFKSVDSLYPNLNMLDIDWVSSKVHLTEGLFDALSLISKGYPAVCNFGLNAPSASKAGLLLSFGFQEIVSAFDNDPAGIEGWQLIKSEWARYLPIGRPTDIVKALRSSGLKDYNEYILKE